MSLFERLFKRKNKKPEFDGPITPEMIEDLPAADDAKFYRNSKLLLQRFDEYITAAEAELETLSIDLDSILEQSEIIKDQILSLNRPESWFERSMLMKLDRLTLHGDNLKQRIEIYSQNIKIYINLISKIQDVKAMRMNGLAEDKIETIWLEFKETMEQYKQRIMAEESGFQHESVTTSHLEDRLKKLRKEILGPEVEQKAKEAQLVEEKVSRPPLVEFLDSKVEEAKAKKEEEAVVAELVESSVEEPPDKELLLE